MMHIYPDEADDALCAAPEPYTAHTSMKQMIPKERQMTVKKGLFVLGGYLGD